MPLARATISSSNTAFTFAYMYWAPGGALTLETRRASSSRSRARDGDESQTPRRRSISSTSLSPLVIESR